jgi:hypothetical protein
MPGLTRRAMLTAGMAAAGAAQAGSRRPPATRQGAPDLQGLWSNASYTKLERPDAFKALAVSAEEAAPYERSARQAWEGANADTVGGRQSEWWEIGASLARIDGQIRTSWIVDPPDGKLPYTVEGRRRLKAMADQDDTAFSGPEDRPPDERCLLAVRSTAGPPMLNANYNTNYQIVQTADHVVILVEMVHDARIIPLNRREHLPSDLRPWMGDPIGRWEGDALVIETTNFTLGDGHKSRTGLYLSPHARVIERLSRISPDQLRYRFEVEDPEIFTRLWRGEMLFQATPGPLYEYACHEGNYGLENILAGARAREAGK